MSVSMIFIGNEGLPMNGSIVKKLLNEAKIGNFLSIAEAGDFQDFTRFSLDGGTVVYYKNMREEFTKILHSPDINADGKLAAIRNGKALEPLISKATLLAKLLGGDKVDLNNAKIYSFETDFYGRVKVIVF